MALIAELPPAGGELAGGLRIALSGGRKRNAAFEILSASLRCAMMIEEFAVMPGRSFNSSLFTPTTVV